MQSSFCSSGNRRCADCGFTGPAFVLPLSWPVWDSLATSYYLVDSSIPSVIYMRAESEESLALDIPAKGEILSVSEQGTSNIPQGAVTLDLSQPVTMKTGMTDSLEMQVKLFGSCLLSRWGSG